MKNKAVFLDRDGTLNDDPGYLHHPAQMKLLPGVGETLAELKKLGYLLIVVSNQSGVGRGLIEADALPRIHARLDELLKPFGASIDHYELCLHRPEENCDCRKPQPKLLLDAAQKLEVEITESFMIGDKASDLEAGRAAGCKKVFLVGTGYGQETRKEVSEESFDGFAASLPEVLQFLQL